MNTEKNNHDEFKKLMKELIYLGPTEAADSTTKTVYYMPIHKTVKDRANIRVVFKASMKPSNAVSLLMSKRCIGRSTFAEQRAAHQVGCVNEHIEKVITSDFYVGDLLTGSKSSNETSRTSYLRVVSSSENGRQNF